LLFPRKFSRNAAQRGGLARPLVIEERPMFISPAYAQAFGDSANSLVQFAPFVLIFVVFYFFLIRPQQQKAKDLKAMLGGLRRGDRVVTGGGIIGTVAKVASDDEVLVDIAEGTRVRVLRSTITTVLAKTERAASKGDKEESDTETEEADKGKGSARRAAGGK
jgi:preprotein translocase subunit YajC